MYGSNNDVVAVVVDDDVYASQAVLKSMFVIHRLPPTQIMTKITARRQDMAVTDAMYG